MFERAAFAWLGLRFDQQVEEDRREECKKGLVVNGRLGLYRVSRRVVDCYWPKKLSSNLLVRTITDC